jgi:hypothetical protein
MRASKHKTEEGLKGGGGITLAVDCECTGSEVSYLMSMVLQVNSHQAKRTLTNHNSRV